eukprot:9171168-Karenia_brevis.AAC.1
MATFSWCKQTVEERLEELPQQDKEKGEAAYDWLWENNQKYKDLVQEHAKFLYTKPNATDKERKRWLRFIERPGVECGLWPHLFWLPELCFTVERHEDPRKVAKREAKKHTTERRLFGPYDDADALDEEGDTAMHSIRR